MKLSLGKTKWAKLVISLVVVLVLLVGSAAIFNRYNDISWYSFLFSRKVVGQVVNIDRVTAPNAIIGSRYPIPDAQMYSFAIAIKESSGEIVTSSSEDRQWAVVEKGQCAEAVYFPYPPWLVDKAGTYFGARLHRLMECPKN